MQKIKIVIGINDLSVGGAQKLIVDLLLNFNREKFEFHLITLKKFSNKKNFYDLIPDYVKVYDLNFTNFFDIKSWYKLFVILKKISPHFVLSSLFFSNTIFRILSLFFSYKTIITEQNTYINKKIFQKIFDKVLSFKTHKIIAVSNTVKKFTSKQELIPEDNFVVIHNGIDTKKIDKEIETLPNIDSIKKELGFSVDDKIFLNVSRLVLQKNHELLLIKGFYLLNKKYKNCVLAIVGDGLLLNNLKEQVNKLGISDRVIFFGNRRDVYKFYKIADAFVSTSIIEGLSVAYLESLASGLPIVCTKTAGTDEIIINGFNGFFIDSFNPESVFFAFEKVFVLDRDLIKANCKKNIIKFDIANIVKKYESLFV